MRLTLQCTFLDEIDVVVYVIKLRDTKEAQIKPISVMLAYRNALVTREISPSAFQLTLGPLSFPDVITIAVVDNEHPNTRQCTPNHTLTHTQTHAHAHPNTRAHAQAQPVVAAWSIPITAKLFRLSQVCLYLNKQRCVPWDPRL